MKTNSLQLKVQVKIENKILKDAFIRQTVFNKKNISKPRQLQIPRNIHPHSFGLFLVCPLRAEKEDYFSQKSILFERLNVITNLV